MDYAKEPNLPYSINHRRVPIAKIKQELLAAHGTRCAFCGIDISSGYIVIDSFLPRHSNPDVNSSDNYVLSCAHCERIKAAKEPFSQDGQILIIHPYSENYRTEIQINNDGIAEGITDAGISTVNLLQLNRPELVSYRKDHISDFIEKINDGNTALDVYNCSITQLKELLQMHSTTPELQEYFYRMIYANVISSMEAYLSKTNISIVLNDDISFWNFVKHFDWGKEKIEIQNIKEVYDGMNIRVQTKLTEVLYHNIPKVKAMYEKILGINILQDSKELEFLTHAVSVRHDLVHRNGRKTTVGAIDEYHSISLEMITELIQHVDKLIEEIESQLNCTETVL